MFEKRSQSHTIIRNVWLLPDDYDMVSASSIIVLRDLFSVNGISTCSLEGQDTESIT